MTLAIYHQPTLLPSLRKPLSSRGIRGQIIVSSFLMHRYFTTMSRWLSVKKKLFSFYLFFFTLPSAIHSCVYRTRRRLFSVASEWKKILLKNKFLFGEFTWWLTKIFKKCLYTHILCVLRKITLQIWWYKATMVVSHYSANETSKCFV